MIIAVLFFRRYRYLSSSVYLLSFFFFLLLFFLFFFLFFFFFFFFFFFLLLLLLLLCWDVRSSKQCDLLWVRFDLDVGRDLLDAFLHPFLYKSQGSYHHTVTVVVFIPHIRSMSFSRSLYLDSFFDHFY